MNEYEARRAEKIKQNQALLAELDIKPIVGARRARDHKSSAVDTEPSRKKIRKTIPAQPSRASARIAATPAKPNYADEPSIKPEPRPSRPTRKVESSQHSSIPETKLSSTTLNVEEFQAEWTNWAPTGPDPQRSSSPSRRFYFADEPSFTPNKSPEELLREGAFGGSYYRPLYSRHLGATIDGDWLADLPTSWREGLDVARYVTSRRYDPDVNKFKVSCGQSIEEWEANGWIAHEYDVRGWFQWYVRFFRGRRCADDARQISRWRKCVGETGRWRRMLLKKYLQAGVRDVFDDGADEDAPEVSPVMHQTCHHWAYEVRQPDLDEAWQGR